MSLTPSEWTFVHLHTQYLQFPDHASYNISSNQLQSLQNNSIAGNVRKRLWRSRRSPFVSDDKESPPKSRFPSLSPLKALLISLELCHKLSSLSQSQILDATYVDLLKHLPLSHVIIATHPDDSTSGSTHTLNITNLFQKMHQQVAQKLSWNRTRQWVGSSSSKDYDVREVPEFLKEGEHEFSATHEDWMGTYLPRLAYGINEKLRILFCAIHLRGELTLSNIDALRDKEQYIFNMDIFDEFLREGYHIVISGHGIAGCVATKLCLNLRRYVKERDAFERGMMDHIRCITFGAPYMYDFSLDMELSPVVDWEMEHVQKNGDAFWNYYTENDILPWMLSYRTNSPTEEDFYSVLDLILTNDSFNSTDASSRLRYLTLLKDVSLLEILKLISSQTSLPSMLEHKAGLSKLMQSIISQSQILLPSRQPIGRCFMRIESSSQHNQVVKLEPMTQEKLTEFNSVLRLRTQNTDPLLLLSHSSMEVYYESFHEMISEAYGTTLFHGENALQVAQRFLPNYTWISSLHTPSPMSPSRTTFDSKQLANRLSYYVLRTPMDEKAEKFENKFTIHSSELEYVKCLEFEEKNHHIRVLPVAQSNVRLVFVFVTEKEISLKVRLHTVFGVSDWVTIAQHEIVTRPMLRGKMFDYANLSLTELVMQATSFSLIRDTTLDSNVSAAQQILNNRAETKVLLYQLEELWAPHLGNPFEGLSTKKRDHLIADFKKYAIGLRPFSPQTRKQTDTTFSDDSLRGFSPLSEIFMRHLSERNTDSEEHILHLLDLSTAFAYSIQKQCATHFRKKKSILEKALIATGLGTTALAFTTVGALGVATGFGLVLSVPSFALAAALGGVIGLGSIAGSGHVLRQWVIGYVRQYTDKLHLIAEALLNIDLTFVREHPLFLEEVIVKKCKSMGNLLKLSDAEITSRWQEIFPDAHTAFSDLIRDSDKQLILKILRSVQYIYHLRLQLSKVCSCGVISCSDGQILEQITRAVTFDDSPLNPDSRREDSVYQIGAKATFLHTFLLESRTDEPEPERVKQKLEDLLVRNHRLVDCVVIIFKKITQKECDLVESFKIPCLLVSIEKPHEDLLTKHTTIDHIDKDSPKEYSVARVVSWIRRAMHALSQVDTYIETV
eukprot:CAMPEP_0117443748 /NCGR_PEP_ID=MMETSP0759-20121206/4865_1 /TAXON_ID=63605 /ORGANISM="Percolomonas cosmopolitus, Strain WS" /LENGTH=1122 /DNA_ID=CAMNT_0005235753 /DNA_START=6 /DNA_END=3375 /DNA_ORIENTATION=-